MSRPRDGFIIRRGQPAREVSARSAAEAAAQAETDRLRREAEAAALQAERRARIISAVDAYGAREAREAARERGIARRRSRQEKRTNRGGW